MATYYSPDLFLEDIDLVVIFLNDGLVTHIPNYDSKGWWHESGDLVNLDNEPAIILGWGEREEDAVTNARAYYQRLIKWHSGDTDTDGELKVEFYGHDLAQSELLNAAYPERDSTDSSEWTDSIDQPARKKRKI